MTTSGTTSFNLDFIEAVEEAYERVGLEVRSGWDAKTARRSINLMLLEWANRGINMWTMEERVVTLTQGVGEYQLDADIVDIIEQVVQLPNQTQTTRYTVSRVSVSTYATRTNPTIQSRPTQIYIERLNAGPKVHLWPLPNIAGYTLHYWILKRIEDAGAYTNTGDFPFRFLPVFVSGLAYHIAEKKASGNPELIMRLKARYEEDWQNAAEEDREKSTLSIVPRGASYRIGA
jgi:hypothetical protein